METAIDLLIGLVKFAFIGVFGLLALAVVFGKRIEKQWEYEAKFFDDRKRELGEFDIELRRIPKDETDWTLKARFVLRHPALQQGARVDVALNDEVVMQGNVEKEGRILLRESALITDIKSPETGQVCSVRVGGSELFAEPLYRD